MQRKSKARKKSVQPKKQQVEDPIDTPPVITGNGSNKNPDGSAFNRPETNTPKDSVSLSAAKNPTIEDAPKPDETGLP